MDILACEEAPPTGRTKRGCHKEVGELRALPGDPVDVRCLHERMSHAAQGIPPKVVDQNEDNVWSIGVRNGGRCARQPQQYGQRQIHYFTSIVSIAMPIVSKPSLP